MQSTAELCDSHSTFLGGGLIPLGPAVAQVLKPVPGGGIAWRGCAADAGEVVAGGQPGGAEISELTGEVLVDQ